MWFGNTSRLSQWGGGGIISLFKWCRGGREGSAPCGCLPPTVVLSVTSFCSSVTQTEITSVLCTVKKLIVAYTGQIFITTSLFSYTNFQCKNQRYLFPIKHFVTRIFVISCFVLYLSFAICDISNAWLYCNPPPPPPPLQAKMSLFLSMAVWWQGEKKLVLLRWRVTFRNKAFVIEKKYTFLELTRTTMKMKFC